MGALANVSYLLKNEWIKYWSLNNISVIQDFDFMPFADQKVLITKFVMHHIPGWPEGKFFITEKERKIVLLTGHIYC